MAYKHDLDKVLTRENLQQDYAELGSLKAVGRKYGVAGDTIKSYMIKYGFDFKPQIKYSCDEDFFTRETEETFYVAGFLAADGCVKDRKNSSGNIRYELQIGLAKKDKEFLEKLRNLLKVEAPINDFLIKNSKRNPMWNDCWKSEITITSKKLCESLAVFNVIPRKTHIYTFPIIVKYHPLVNHFMRGYFDGDGSFFINTKKNRITKQIYTSVRGTPDFLKEYRLILEKECNLEKRETDVRLNSGIGVLEYGGNNIVSKIAQFLYKDATIFLPRKKEIINHLLHQ